MEKLFGWTGTLLHVDLSSGKVSRTRSMDYAENFIGGRLLASRLYWDEISKDTGALEEERDHPDFIEVSMKNIALFEEIIAYCQRRGQLAAGKVELVAIKLWSSVHGFTNLILENQFPPEYMQAQDLKTLIKVALS